MRHIKQSAIIPVCMLAYLAVMAYIGRDNYTSGNKSLFFGVIILSLIIILLLHLALRKKERLRQMREDDELYGKYDTDENSADDTVPSDNDNAR